MRRLACLLPLVFSLGVACTAVDPLTSDSPESYGRAPGTTAASEEDSGSTASPTSPPSSGSAPSPIVHHDAGSWQADAQSPIVSPPPVYPEDDAGSPTAPSAEDSGAPGANDSGSSNDALLVACVGAINAFRGQNDLQAYTRSASLEAFAAQAAASDSQSGQSDGYFNQTGGNNVSFAEDEFDGAQIDPGATATQVLQQGLLDEENGEIDGNGNLLDEQASEVGCGVAQAPDGSYWIAIEYR